MSHDRTRSFHDECDEQETSRHTEDAAKSIGDAVADDMARSLCEPSTILAMFMAEAARRGIDAARAIDLFNLLCVTDTEREYQEAMKDLEAAIDRGEREHERMEELGTIGICIACGEEKRIDACGYCSGCYPYDSATDVYKQDVECHTPSVLQLRDEDIEHRCAMPRGIVHSV